MQTCRPPKNSRLLFVTNPGVSIILLLFGMLIFFMTSYSLAMHTFMFPDDTIIQAQLTPLRHAIPAGVMAGLIQFGNFGSIAPSLVVLYLVYRALRERCDDRFDLILGSYLFGLILFWITGYLFNRQRPALPGLLKQEPFPSYPSGHMIQTITMLVPLLYLYVPKVKSNAWRIVILLAALLYTLFVGADRLLTNAHYFTDVLGGIALGVLWAMIVLLLYEWHQARVNGT